MFQAAQFAVKPFYKSFFSFVCPTLMYSYLQYVIVMYEYEYNHSERSLRAATKSVISGLLSVDVRMYMDQTFYREHRGLGVVVLVVVVVLVLETLYKNFLFSHSLYLFKYINTDGSFNAIK